MFADRAFFVDTKFIKEAFFANAKFKGLANFADAIFTERAYFGAATFSEEANFVNSKMKSVTIFDDASFLNVPPLFDGAELHEGTSWFSVHWPILPRTKEQARKAVRAYERLKLEMDKLKKHEDELDFFTRELQARGILAGNSTFQGLAIRIYGFLCDYGSSYGRPAWFLVTMIVLGALPFIVDFGVLGSLGLSFSNTFGVLGFRREFLAQDIAALSLGQKFFSGFQTIAGGVLFFLFGLGLRNRFRMK